MAPSVRRAAPKSYYPSGVNFAFSLVEMEVSKGERSFSSLTQAKGRPENALFHLQVLRS